jgi:hypothetical protein
MQFSNQEIKRAESFRRNNDLEIFLKEINADLWFTEKKLIEKAKKDYPLIFIIGAFRSGTTLFMQWLANTGKFSYPTNLLSRFYGAPIIGAKIQKLLTDKRYNFRNEILDFKSEINYKSENGKTKGALSPNEFWYFWRRFLPFNDIDYLTNKELFEKVDIQTFKREILGIASVFHKPFALKGAICNYNIKFLDDIFDKAIFIYTKRDPMTNIKSAIEARKRQLGSIYRWYSFKIPEYYDLIKIDDPVKQIAGQIFYINRAISKGLLQVDEIRKVTVQYEDFCDHPEKYYDEIVEKLKCQGCYIKSNYNGPKYFKITRDNFYDSKIMEAYNEFIKKNNNE